MKQPGIPTIEITYPLVSDESWALNRGRLDAIISSRKEINSALETAIKNADRSKFKLNKSDASKLINVYNAVIADGRFIKDFLTDPGGVAKKLRMSLPSAAIDAVRNASETEGIRGLLLQGGPADPEFLAIVAVAIVVVFIIVQLPNDVDGKLCGSIKVSKGQGKYNPKICYDRSKLIKL